MFRYSTHLLNVQTTDNRQTTLRFTQKHTKQHFLVSQELRRQCLKAEIEKEFEMYDPDNPTTSPRWLSCS